MENINTVLMEKVSGAENYADKHETGNSSGRGGAPDSCANRAGLGAIIGTLGALATGATGGLAGVVVAGVTGGLSSVIGCENPSYNDNNSGNSSRSGNYGAQCTW
ncbi:hypothetical protein [Erwinia papayae]|uniref:hypothetical protein n=1 Tax=Erwinia papayae TaxID=206499 RepID=UPI003F58D7A2